MALPFASFLLNKIAREEFSYIKPYLRFALILFLVLAVVFNLFGSFFTVLFFFILFLSALGVFLLFLYKKKKESDKNSMIKLLSDYAFLFAVFPLVGSRFFIFSAIFFFWYYFSYSSLNHEFEMRFKIFDSLFFLFCFVLSFVLFRI